MHECTPALLLLWRTLNTSIRKITAPFSNIILHSQPQTFKPVHKSPRIHDFLFAQTFLQLQELPSLERTLDSAVNKQHHDRHHRVLQCLSLGSFAVLPHGSSRSSDTCDNDTGRAVVFPHVDGHTSDSRSALLTPSHNSAT
jgi:hypothetical protein